MAKSKDESRLLIKSRAYPKQYASIFEGDTPKEGNWRHQDEFQLAIQAGEWETLPKPESYHPDDVSANSRNRERLLKLIDILHKKTDKNHYISITELQALLENEWGTSVSKGTINNDLQFLNSIRHVLVQGVGHNKYVYAMPQTDFDILELRMLVDAVASSRSITPEMTKELIRKITSMTSEHEAKRLKHLIVLERYVKAASSELADSIDMIHQAINDKVKVTFQYQKYTPRMTRELRDNGKNYHVVPFSLIWSNDYYYLVGRPDDGPDQKTFRVDRMVNVNLTNDSFVRPSFSVTDFLAKSFFMYPGEVHRVEIQFVNQLINVVVDRFGDKIHVDRVDDDHFKILIDAAISEGLIRWLLTWGGDAKVLRPAHLVETMRQESLKLLAQYQ